MDEYNTGSLLVQHIEKILRDKSPGIPDFIRQLPFYQEFILPTSFALALQSPDIMDDRRMKKWCISIEDVTFTTNHEETLKPDDIQYDFSEVHKWYYPSTVCDSIHIYEKYGDSIVCWNIHISEFSDLIEYVLMLISVYDDIPVADKILFDINDKDLTRFIFYDLKDKITNVILGSVNSNIKNIVVNWIDKMLEFIKHRFDFDFITRYAIPEIDTIMKVCFDDPEQKDIEGVALLLKVLNDSLGEYYKFHGQEEIGL